MYYPLHDEPYSPAHHFAEGKADPDFRTKLAIAVELIQRAVNAGIPFRAVVADCFYGEDRGVQQYWVEQSDKQTKGAGILVLPDLDDRCEALLG